MRAVKISVGCALSIIVAQLLGCDFYQSAGSITLLTILETKKETLRLTATRLLSFGMTLFFSVIIFNLIGVHWIAFMIVVFLLVIFTMLFQCNNTLSVNFVICTHFISASFVGIPEIFNELLLLLVGTGFAILLNLFFFDESKLISQDIRNIESQLRQIINTLADHLSTFDQSSSITKQVDDLETSITASLDRSLRFFGNSSHKAAHFYKEYMEMRYSQTSTLRNFQSSLRMLTALPPQVQLIHTFMYELADSIHEQENMERMLPKLDAMIEELKKQPLPTNHQDFSNQAILYHMIIELKEYLMIKKHFVESLDSEERRMYWHR